MDIIRTKQRFFEALVSEPADGLMEQFKAAQQAHFELIPEDKAATKQRIINRLFKSFYQFLSTTILMLSNW